MDEKAKKKRSKIDISDLGSSFDRDPNKGKKKKERKKEQAADKILNLNEALGGNCTGEAVDNLTCCTEGNIMLMRNKEDGNHENKRKKKNRNVADDKVVQFLDDNQECNIKKRKKYDCSVKGNNSEHDDQSKKKKKKLGEENQHEECNEFKGNELKNGDQDKKMKKKEKKLSEEGKTIEIDEFKTNEIEADDQGKQKKKEKKSAEESQHKENIGNGHKDNYPDKKMKMKEKKNKLKMKEKKNKLCDKSKSKEISKFDRNEGGVPLDRVTEVDDQGKKTNLKKKDKAGSGDPQWQRRSQIAKQNRSIDHDAVSYTGGSVSVTEHRKIFVAQHGREPTGMEVMERTKKLRDGSWICGRAKDVADAFQTRSVWSQEDLGSLLISQSSPSSTAHTSAPSNRESRMERQVLDFIARVKQYLSERESLLQTALQAVQIATQAAERAAKAAEDSQRLMMELSGSHLSPPSRPIPPSSSSTEDLSSDSEDEEI